MCMTLKYNKLFFVFSCSAAQCWCCWRGGGGCDRCGGRGDCCGAGSGGAVCQVKD